MTETCPFDPALFGEAAIDAETAKLNALLVDMLTGQPEWWIVGAEAARAARRRGEGPFPAPVMSSRARTVTITGKDGNEIPLRVIAPAQPRGDLSASARRRLGAGRRGHAGPDAGTNCR
jgi:acetyl esterase